MSNQAGQYFTPGRSWRMPATRAHALGLYLAALELGVSRAVSKGPAPSPCNMLSHPSQQWSGRLCFTSTSRWPGRSSRHHAGHARHWRWRCSSPWPLMLGMQHTARRPQQLSAPHHRLTQEMTAYSMSCGASPTGKVGANRECILAFASQDSLCKSERAQDANAACSTTPAMSFRRDARSTVGPEPRLCPYSTTSSARTPCCCVSHLANAWRVHDL